MFLFLTLLFNQTPLLVESFTNPDFPPPGWDTTFTDTTIDWFRHQYTTANPDSFHARVRVYDASNWSRIGTSTLTTPPLNLYSFSGPETLSFWYRFSQSSNNLGPDDTLFIEISNNGTGWSSLFKINQSNQTSTWTVPRISLLNFDSYQNALVRFRYEDRPNSQMGSTNCNFWLDSVKVISYFIDTIPPQILNTAPASGDTGVGIASNILIYFSEPIDTLSIIPQAFNITGDSSGIHTFSIFYDSINKSVQLNPDFNFTFGETVYVTVYDTIRDIFGNRLDGDNNGIPGGNYSLYFLTASSPDTVPPAAVSNLTISEITAESVKLRWTAPGDDGNSGRASYYDIRYATFLITEDNFSIANECAGESPPSISGLTDSFVVTGLQPATLYYFALKTADEDSNWSPVSNVPSCTTLTPLETLLVLNEFLPDPKTFDHNHNGNYNDLDEEFIEVFNKGSNYINLSGYKINDLVGGHSLTIPQNFNISPFGYLLLYASGEAYIIHGDGDTLQTGNWFGNWPDLDQAGDTVRLYDNLNRMIDGKGYQSIDVICDFSIARLPNGSPTWINNAFPTPGAFNGIEYVWPITVAFKDLDSNYVPDLLDSTVTISGVVTVPNGLFSSREAYIQDNTGGVCLYTNNFPIPLNYGDSIIATGTVDQYRGKNELTNFTYQILKQNCPIPAPLEIDGNIANTENYEGSLVKIKVSSLNGFLLEVGDYSAWDLNNTPFKIYINAGTNIPGHLAPIDTFTLTGIKSQYTTSSIPDNGYEILPRDTFDFSHLLILPEVKTIATCQTPGSDGVTSVYLDSLVCVEGVLTGPNSVFTSGNNSFYIQDSTGGINVYNVNGDSEFSVHIDSLGSRFKILGRISEYNGLTEISNGYGWFLGRDSQPEPKVLASNRYLTEGMEGILITFTGVIATLPYQTGDGYNFDVLNGECGIAVRFTANSGINPQTIKKDGLKKFIGIVGQYDPEPPYTTGYQLLLRSPSDILTPSLDSASAKPKLEIVGPKTFLPERGEQARIKINSPPEDHLTLDVYDMNGRKVKRLYDGAGGPQDIFWNGRDENSRPCKIGIYLLNLKAVNGKGKSEFLRSLIVVGTQF
uniref:T9SS type A sorting domain-containing protein n=1 Tax=candidate division WOR-3 bacterium TaxID=2052148 RepID=A0A7C4X958_UNCW3